MTRLDDARQILQDLGLPPEQHNEIAGYTLLALTGMKKRTKWSDAGNPRVRVHDILVWVAETYKKRYAENTRETIRRRVLHQLEQARVVDRNPDDPDLPTNSPRTHYALTSQALAVVRAFRSRDYRKRLSNFRQSHGALFEVYAGKRRRAGITVHLPSGETLRVSPGEHNELQRALIDGFAPRFAAGAQVLYFGDTAKKNLHVEKELLARLGFPVSQHDKLPDIVLYSPQTHVLYLIEAVTSHGPVSPKRHLELETLLRSCTARRIYVSAFPSFHEFKKHLQNIAWETEVWIAEIPDHMIHFNGDRFLPSP